MSFNVTTAYYTTTFTYNSDVNAPTVIFVSDEYYYSNGYKMTITVEGNELNPGFYTVDSTEKNYLQIQLTDGGLNGEDITITIEAL